MEWLVLIGLYFLFRFIYSAATSGSKMNAFEIKASEEDFDIEGRAYKGVKIEAKGLFGNLGASELSFVTSVVDITEEQPKPVLSAIDSFQEGQTMAYQYTAPAGYMNTDMGFPNWSQVAVAFQDTLVCPRKGNRVLRFTTYIIDPNNPPPFYAGFIEETTNLINAAQVEFLIFQTENGYEEARENEEKSILIIIKLGLFVAMADGNIDPKEGEIIRGWVKRILESYEGEKKTSKKDLYNETIKESFEKVKQGKLSLGSLVEDLNETGDKSIKYQAVELCMDVMAADGVAEENEMITIRKISDGLGLDFDEIQGMNDKRMVQLDVSLEKESSLDSLLGFDPNWPTEKIKTHLNKEFSKWNGRMQSLKEGKERERAQEMLDLIAEARQKYK